LAGPIYATATDDRYLYDADPVWPDLRPHAPGGLARPGNSVVSGQEVHLTWTDNSGIEDGFLIEMAEGSGDFEAVAFVPASAAAAPATVAFTLSGPFHPSTAYHFRVGALAGSTLSDPTNTLDVLIPAVPEYPTGLAATANSQTQITLAWTDHAGDDEDYTVQRSADGGATWTTIALGDHQTGYVDGGLASGSRYVYRVFASNSAGPSGYAAAELATLPAAPVSLAAAAVSFRRIDLDWADVSGNDIVGYSVYRDTSSNFTPDDAVNLIDFAGDSSPG
jgi:titin